MCPAKSGANSSKQITPSRSPSAASSRRALARGEPVTTVTGAFGA